MFTERERERERGGGGGGGGRETETKIEYQPTNKEKNQNQQYRGFNAGTKQRSQSTCKRPDKTMRNMWTAHLVFQARFQPSRLVLLQHYLCNGQFLEIFRVPKTPLPFDQHIYYWKEPFWELQSGSKLFMLTCARSIMYTIRDVVWMVGHVVW